MNSVDLRTEALRIAHDRAQPGTPLAEVLEEAQKIFEFLCG